MNFDSLLKCNHDLTLNLLISTECLEGRVNKLSDTQVATPLIIRLQFCTHPNETDSL